MPPIATENITTALPAALNLKGDEKASKQIKTEDEHYKYKWALPYANHEVKLPPLESFEHIDPGHAALKRTGGDNFTFLRDATEIDPITPRFGSSIKGVQLDRLTSEQRDEIALFVAQRGVAVFHDQNFVDRDAEWLKDWGRHFGRLHVHPTSVQPKDHLEFHLVYKGTDREFVHDVSQNLDSVLWHSDVTYEKQPPGTTTLFLFDTPISGGDTLFADQRALYQRLSPSFRAYLETLSAVHSGVEQAQASRNGKYGGTVKREPVENIHPLVRKHPVTGEKALFVQPQFTRRIVGLKKEESDAILHLLYNHIARAADAHARIRWRKKSVVLWDNRITAHTALVDFVPGADGRRHGARITPQAEAPFL